MSWDWHRGTYPCPACEAPTWTRFDRDEANLLECQDECRACRLWGYEFAYGGHQERIGFACFMWSYSDVESHEPIRAAARRELRELYRHPEHAAAAGTLPKWALADWLGDKGFVLQEAALRSLVATVGEVEEAMAQVGELS